MAGTNNVRVEQLRISRVPINPANTINLGDNLKWDGTNRVATPVVAGDAASATAAAAYLGVAQDAEPITSLNQNLPFNQMNVVTKGLVEFTCDDNATYLPGDAVTFGAGPQLIRHTANSGTAVIGYVAPENNFVVTSGASVGIVAVANVTKLLIYIRPQITNLQSAG